jgi:hypothetical protein
MDRRVFLREAVMAAGVVGCGVGGLWWRCSRARGQVVQQLMDSARPVLDKHALQEQELPGPAAMRVKAYFDGLCLNVEGYVGEVSAPAFRQKLSKIHTTERRHRELMAVFYRRLDGAANIGDHIHAIAASLGPELDRHWSACCVEIGTRWESRLSESKGPQFDAEAFSDRATTTVRQQIEQAVQRSKHVADEPGWREAIRSLGTEALLAGKEVSLEIGGQTIQVPEFVLAASRRALGKLLDSIGDPKWDCQKMLTARLAEMGKLISAEFEKAIRQRLNDLHVWREQAVRLSAEQYAAERVGWFGEHG